MGKTVIKSFEEIRKEWTPEKLRALSAKVSALPDDDPDPITDEDVATGRVKFIGRGFAVVQEILDRNARLESDNTKTAKTSSRPRVAVAAEA